MKLNKRILTILIIGGISLSVVGCGSTANNNKNTSNNQSEAVLDESSVKEKQGIEENQEIDKKQEESTITEKEALSIIEGYVHKLIPEAKLKVESKEYVGGTECYIIKYDTKFATESSFIVDVNTGEAKATVYMSNEYKSIEEWIKASKSKLNDEYYSPEEAKNRALYTISFESGEYHRPGFSKYQEANIELAEDYRVEVDAGQFCWVFKYPMETKQVMTERGYSETNAYDENDEFGYFYVNPRMNWIMFIPYEWNPEELLEVGSLDN